MLTMLCTILGLQGETGSSFTFFGSESAKCAYELVQVLTTARQPIPDGLKKLDLGHPTVPMGRRAKKSGKGGKGGGKGGFEGKGGKGGGKRGGKGGFGKGGLRTGPFGSGKEKGYSTQYTRSQEGKGKGYSTPWG
jgi:hypothetical protein